MHSWSLRHTQAPLRFRLFGHKNKQHNDNRSQWFLAMSHPDGVDEDDSSQGNRNRIVRFDLGLSTYWLSRWWLKNTVRRLEVFAPWRHETHRRRFSAPKITSSSTLEFVIRTLRYPHKESCRSVVILFFLSQVHITVYIWYSLHHTFKVGHAFIISEKCVMLICTFALWSHVSRSNEKSVSSLPHAARRRAEMVTKENKTLLCQDLFLWILQQ